MAASRERAIMSRYRRVTGDPIFHPNHRRNWAENSTPNDVWLLEANNPVDWNQPPQMWRRYAQLWANKPRPTPALKFGSSRRRTIGYNLNMLLLPLTAEGPIFGLTGIISGLCLARPISVFLPATPIAARTAEVTFAA